MHALNDIALVLLHYFTLSGWATEHNLSDYVSARGRGRRVVVVLSVYEWVVVAGHARSLDGLVLAKERLVLCWRRYLLLFFSNPSLFKLLVRVRITLEIPRVVEDKDKVVVFVNATRNVTVVLDEFFQSYITVSLTLILKVKLSLKCL